MSNGNTLQCPAIDSIYVDAYTADPVWSAATQEEKDAAILDACYYFKANYACPYVDYTQPLPTEIQNAMAELSVIDINGNLYSASNKESLLSSSIKAGSASISKTFSHGVSQVDPDLLKVKDMVTGFCTFTGGNVSPIIRA